jgi:hypothetical protein
MATVVPVEWETLGGNDSPSQDFTAISWGPGRLDLFYRGNDNMLYHKYFDSGAWTPSMTDWESLGAINRLPADITAVSWGPGRLDLFYPGIDGAIYHKYFDSGVWKPSMTDWESLGGNTNGVTAITAVSWGPGRLDLFYPLNEGPAYHKYFDSGVWGPSMTDWDWLGTLTPRSPPYRGGPGGWICSI